jgi:hypothetical protein
MTQMETGFDMLSCCLLGCFSMQLAALGISGRFDFRARLAANQKQVEDRSGRYGPGVFRGENATGAHGQPALGYPVLAALGKPAGAILAAQGFLEAMAGVDPGRAARRFICLLELAARVGSMLENGPERARVSSRLSIQG